MDEKTKVQYTSYQRGKETCLNVYRCWKGSFSRMGVNNEFDKIEKDALEVRALIVAAGYKVLNCSVGQMELSGAYIKFCCRIDVENPEAQRNMNVGDRLLDEKKIGIKIQYSSR